MNVNADEHRAQSAAQWEAAAAGWARRQDAMREFAAPVSHWMIDALRLQPGHRVLELAAGVGETGFLAAELVAPSGGVITSDQAEAMLDAARARAAELELTNVEFQVINAEWIDLPVASVDAVLCRWGYMLMADPLAALRETRRVLKPGGRLALAVWDASERNPWATLPMLVLIERGVVPPPEPGTPGPFALGDPERLRGLLNEAGFGDVVVGGLDLEQRHTSFDAFWEISLDCARTFHDAVMSLPEAEAAAVRAAVAGRLQPFMQADGSLAIPARTLVAAAGA
jgi:ubiquinone/menaquinone biosynthesis C-methylase UbiE